MTSERWSTINDREGFLQCCPDFIIELRSQSDRLQTLQAKMGEWITNGCRLAWLIDPEHETAHVYRADGSIEVVESFDGKLFGEDVLPGFELDLGELR